MNQNVPASPVDPVVGDRRATIVACAIALLIAVALFCRYALGLQTFSDSLLVLGSLVGGVPIVWSLLRSLAKLEVNADFLAGLSIITSLLLGEYLAGAIIVLMLAGGRSLESYAVHKASAVLAALHRNAPQIAHRVVEQGMEDVAVDQIAVGDIISLFPHESCPVDGVVVEGEGSMDESFLTGEPYRMPKVVGSDVISGAMNGESVLRVRSVKPAADSRYARIVETVRHAQTSRPRVRRLGDVLGGAYTPFVLVIAAGVWWATESASRFLSILLVATPCPLLIGIPVVVIGSVSLAAKRGIVIRNPAALELVRLCKVMIFDKTGTLTYGKPMVTGVSVASGQDVNEVVGLTASLERYSKHPLSQAIVKYATQQAVPLLPVQEMQERPGQGLQGKIGVKKVVVTGRSKLAANRPDLLPLLPPLQSGLECIVLVDDHYAATFNFHDAPRSDSRNFIQHLFRKHGIERVLLISGDRSQEVRKLAEHVGIDELHAEKSPEEKLVLVRAITAQKKTVYLGDGVNDAPALLSASVGIAFGSGSDITTEAADAVILHPTLAKVDEFFHIGERMRSVALQTAIGGMAISLAGIYLAAIGVLTPVGSALLQEGVDVAAILYALRAAVPPASLVDYDSAEG